MRGQRPGHVVARQAMAPVEHDGASAADDAKVGRLQVAVHDVDAVRGFEDAQQFDREAHCGRGPRVRGAHDGAVGGLVPAQRQQVGPAQWARAGLAPLGQCGDRRIEADAADQVHHQEAMFAVAPRVLHAHGPRMVELGEQAPFAFDDAIDVEGRAGQRGEHLDGDEPVELAVARAPDLAGATAADGFVQFVAVGEQGVRGQGGRGAEGADGLVDEFAELGGRDVRDGCGVASRGVRGVRGVGGGVGSRVGGGTVGRVARVVGREQLAQSVHVPRLGVAVRTERRGLGLGHGMAQGAAGLAGAAAAAGGGNNEGRGERVRSGRADGPRGTLAGEWVKGCGSSARASGADQRLRHGALECGS